jgi:hypothetical protein
MAINVNSNYASNNYEVMKKFQEVYKKNTPTEKISVKNSNNINTEIMRELDEKNIREYLTVEEKILLKEVFGDINLDKNSNFQYSGTKFSTFLKGSQIDIKL